jgi:predicted site-specific integrase-resolvase
MTTAPAGPDPLLTRQRAADRLGVDPRTIDRYIERGLLVAHREIGTRRVGIEPAGVEMIRASRLVFA